MASSDLDSDIPTPDPEYPTFCEYFEELVDTVKVDIGAFYNALLAKGYIPTDVCDYIQTDGITDADKAQKLLDTVRCRISGNPMVFHGFTNLFNSKKPSIERIFRKLQDSYKFKLNSSFFPCLKSPQLDYKAIMDLHDRLLLDTTKVIIKFVELSMKIRKSLECRHVSLEEIKSYIISLQAFINNENGVKVISEESKDRIEAAESLSEVFLILNVQNYISFLNYHLLKHIVDHYGSDDDKMKLEEYLAALQEFSKRSALEVPILAVFGQPQSRASIWGFQYSEAVTITPEELETLRSKVAKALGLHPYCLLLCLVKSVKKGCIELYYLIPAAVTDCIFPLSPSQHLTLYNIGINFLNSKTVKPVGMEQK